MTLKALFALPSWISPFSTVPRCQLITFYTHNHAETLGQVTRRNGQHIWQPTIWGSAITQTLENIAAHNQMTMIKAFTVMPNHVHIFVLYQKYHANLPNWFINRLKNHLVEQMHSRHRSSGPIWAEKVSAQLVYTESAQYAIAESLREHEQHWRYDPLHK